MGDADAGRGLGHTVQIDQRAAVTARPIGSADDQRVRDRMTAILLHEFMERGLSQTGDKDRFVMRQQTHVQKPPVRVQRHQHIDRRAREPRQGRHRFRFKNISGRCPARVQQFPNAIVVQRLTQFKGRHDQRRNIISL